MKIKLTSVMVSDQDRALALYTDVLGFVKKQDFPAGEFKWITVVSPDEPDGTELALEPNDNPAGRTFQKALFSQGIPLATFAVEDIQAEYHRLKGLGVVFTHFRTLNHHRAHHRSPRRRDVCRLDGPDAAPPLARPRPVRDDRSHGGRARAAATASWWLTLRATGTSRPGSTAR
jgi:catechol 2,3-dioxygenase-like lactoylglutathione lyase family enzyme